MSNARPQGLNGPTRIPFAEIAAYCDLHGYDFGKRQDFLFYIERLDDKFMEIVKKKREEEERKNNTGKGNNTQQRPRR